MAQIDLIDVFMSWLAGIRFSVVRVAIHAGVAWLLLWVIFAPMLSGRRIRDSRPPAAQMRREMMFSVRTLVIFNTIVIPMIIAEKLGWLHGPEIARQWGPAWFALNVLLMLIAHDTYFYWTHRLMHRRRFFRLCHRQHHRSNNPSPFAMFSFDIPEAVVQGAFVPLWVLIVPTEPLTAFVFTTISLVVNAAGHSGYELFPAGKDGKPLFPWLVTITHHDLHHRDAGWNFSFYFTFWDRFMGTLHPQYEEIFAEAVRKRPAKVDVAHG